MQKTFTPSSFTSYHVHYNQTIITIILPEEGGEKTDRAEFTMREWYEIGRQIRTKLLGYGI